MPQLTTLLLALAFRPLTIGGLPPSTVAYEAVPSDFGYEVRAAASDPRGGALIAGLREQVGAAKRGTLWLCRVTADGITESAHNVSGLALRDVLAVMPQQSGSVTLLAIMPNNSLVAIKAYTGSRPFKVTSIAQPRGVFARRVVASPDGSFIAIGQSPSAAVITKIDGDGSVVWVHPIDTGQRTIPVDLLSVPDGGIVVVLNSGKLDQGWGRSVVIVELRDGGGQLIARTTFKGRHGHVAHGPGSDYLVAYDASQDPGQDIRLVVRSVHGDRNSAGHFGAAPVA